MIALIEAAIVQRLRQGLGKLVTGVHSYGGELDDEGLYQVVQQLPAAWVTFAGIDKTEAVKTSRTKHKAEAKFVVMVAARSLRSEETSRTGGIGHWEIGSYQLIYAVRRLLANQDLGLAIDKLQPRAVRTLFNGRMERQEAMSVYACEFATHWIEEALDNGRWPKVPPPPPPGSPPSPPHPDQIFVTYQAATSPPYPELKGANLHVHAPPTNPTPAIEAEVKTGETP